MAITPYTKPFEFNVTPLQAPDLTKNISGLAEFAMRGAEHKGKIDELLNRSKGLGDRGKKLQETIKTRWHEKIEEISQNENPFSSSQAIYNASMGFINSPEIDELKTSEENYNSLLESLKGKNPEYAGTYASNIYNAYQDGYINANDIPKVADIPDKFDTLSYFKDLYNSSPFKKDGIGDNMPVTYEVKLNAGISSLLNNTDYIKSMAFEYNNNMDISEEDKKNITVDDFIKDKAKKEVLNYLNANLDIKPEGTKNTKNPNDSNDSDGFKPVDFINMLLPTQTKPDFINYQDPNNTDSSVKKIIAYFTENNKYEQKVIDDLHTLILDNIIIPDEVEDKETYLKEYKDILKEASMEDLYRIVKYEQNDKMTDKFNELMFNNYKRTVDFLESLDSNKVQMSKDENGILNVNLNEGLYGFSFKVNIDTGVIDYNVQDVKKVYENSDNDFVDDGVHINDDITPFEKDKTIVNISDISSEKLNEILNTYTPEELSSIYFKEVSSIAIPTGSGYGSKKVYVYKTAGKIKAGLDRKVGDSINSKRFTKGQEKVVPNILIPNYKDLIDSNPNKSYLSNISNALKNQVLNAITAKLATKTDDTDNYTEDMALNRGSEELFKKLTSENNTDFTVGDVKSVVISNGYYYIGVEVKGNKDSTNNSKTNNDVIGISYIKGGKVDELNNVFGDELNPKINVLNNVYSLPMAMSTKYSQQIQSHLNKPSYLYGDTKLNILIPKNIKDIYGIDGDVSTKIDYRGGNRQIFQTEFTLNVPIAGLDNKFETVTVKGETDLKNLDTYAKFNEYINYLIIKKRKEVNEKHSNKNK